MPHDVQTIAVSDIHLDPHNARLHPEDNLEAISSSLTQFGQVEPLVVQKSTMRVISGNGRLTSLMAMGKKDAECVVVDWDDAKSKAYSLVANRTAEMAKWDMDVMHQHLESIGDSFDMAALGFDAGSIADLNFDALQGDGAPEAMPEIDEADAPEKKEQSKTQDGQLFMMGDHRVMCGDSTDMIAVERLMDGAKADLLLTDPPYGVSYADKNAFLNTISRGNRIQERIENDHMSAEDMNKFWDVVLSSAHWATTEKASYYIFSPQGGDLMMMMMSIQKAKWQLKHMLVWVKNNHVLGRCDYNYKHEPVFYGWKEKGTHEFFGDGSCVSTLHFNKPQRNDLHPTMKPVELCAYLIKNSSRKGGKVLDLFGGSGSTLMAAEQMGRACFMMEKDPGYVDVIVARWEKATGDTAEKVS